MLFLLAPSQAHVQPVLAGCSDCGAGGRGVGVPCKLGELVRRPAVGLPQKGVADGLRRMSVDD